MVKGKTNAGFEFEIDMANIEDMRFIEDLADADEGEPRALRRVLDKMLGKAQKERLYEFYQDEKGRVPVDSIRDAIGEMFASIGDESKN